jgi:hypothetical protein
MDVQSTQAYTALIRTYNCEATLGATLDSLEGQTAAPAEYVVISANDDAVIEQGDVRVGQRESLQHLGDHRGRVVDELLHDGTPRAESE